MNKKLLAKLQLNKLKMLSKNIYGFDIIDIIDINTSEAKSIKEYLRGMSNCSFPKFVYTKISTDENIAKWLAENLKFIKNDSVIMTTLLNCYNWVCKIRIVDVQAALLELWKLGDISLFDCKNEIGIYVGISEDSCYISIKNNSNLIIH